MMEHSELFFSLEKVRLERNGNLVIDHFDWKVKRGECWWIYGENGSGKTTLFEALSGKQSFSGGEFILSEGSDQEIFRSSVALVGRDFSFSHYFNKSATFYQQRYFSTGVEETPLVKDFIECETGIPAGQILSAAQEFGFDSLLGKRILSLSTGEGRRIILLMLWLTDKKLICLDDPYAGLDPGGKMLVNNAMGMLLEKNVTIFISGNDRSYPGIVDNVLHIRNRRIEYSGEAKNFKDSGSSQLQKIKIKNYVTGGYDYSFSVAAEMKNITIRYDKEIVQEDFSWKIARGDKWMLTGPNGSGKSTLMSLIYGDNPMAYAYEIVIFDRVRGSGETIWEIKQPMGYFSSELQQFFPRSMTAYEAVLTGFSNHLVISKDLASEHYRQADELIEAAQLTELKNTPLYRLSFSKCRLVLVCRALVKHPPVVILDEPCQGLDPASTEIVNNLVDVVCGDELKTLIYVTHQSDHVPSVINRHLSLRKPVSSLQKN
jgi:molybdate transport system ATP-binding protein